MKRWHVTPPRFTHFRWWESAKWMRESGSWIIRTAWRILLKYVRLFLLRTRNYQLTCRENFVRKVCSKNAKKQRALTIEACHKKNFSLSSKSWFLSQCEPGKKTVNSNHCCELWIFEFFMLISVPGHIAWVACCSHISGTSQATLIETSMMTFMNDKKKPSFLFSTQDMTLFKAVFTRDVHQVQKLMRSCDRESLLKKSDRVSKLRFCRYFRNFHSENFLLQV